MIFRMGNTIASFGLITLSLLAFQNCAKMTPTKSEPKSETEGSTFSVSIGPGGQMVFCTVYTSVRNANGVDYNVQCNYSGPPIQQIPGLTLYSTNSRREHRECTIPYDQFDIYEIAYWSPSYWNMVGTSRYPAPNTGARFLFPPGNHTVTAAVSVGSLIDGGADYSTYYTCYSNEEEHIAVQVPNMPMPECPWADPAMCGMGGDTPPPPPPAEDQNFDAKFCISFKTTSGKNRTKCATGSTPEIGVSIDRTKPATLKVTVDKPGTYSCQYRDKTGATGACDLAHDYTIDPSIYPANYWIQTTVTRQGQSSGKTRKIAF